MSREDFLAGFEWCVEARGGEVDLVINSAVCSLVSHPSLNNQKSFTMPQIFVRSLDRTFVVTVDENATVSDLKERVEDVEFIPAGKSFL